MKTYKEHWKQKNNKAINARDTFDMSSGVSCPNCKNELRVNYTISLMSNPSKSHAWCENCDFEGYL